jgi:hypothetical protein
MRTGNKDPDAAMTIAIPWKPMVKVDAEDLAAIGNCEPTARSPMAEASRASHFQPWFWYTACAVSDMPRWFMPMKSRPHSLLGWTTAAGEERLRRHRAAQETENEIGEYVI